MENDLKRVARLEYLKLRQLKQTEKSDAVKVGLYRRCDRRDSYKHRIRACKLVIHLAFAGIRLLEGNFKIVR